MSLSESEIGLEAEIESFIARLEKCRDQYDYATGRHAYNCALDGLRILESRLNQFVYEKTERRFDIIKFKDRYDVECSIQKSSLATEDAIWLGCSEIEIQTFIPGPGWRKWTIEQLKIVLGGREIVANNRMHLSIEKVRELLPILHRFVDTGEIIEDQANTDSDIG